MLNKENLLSSCFTVLEQTISHLAEGSAVPLESKQVQQLHAALTGAFNGVLFFLSFVARECPDKVSLVNINYEGTDAQIIKFNHVFLCVV